MAKKIIATLVRGNCYYFGNERFDANKPKEVTEATRDHLADTAIDEFNAGGEAFTKPKFKFEEVDSTDSGEQSDSTSKTTRKRSAAK